MFPSARLFRTPSGSWHTRQGGWLWYLGDIRQALEHVPNNVDLVVVDDMFLDRPASRFFTYRFRFPYRNATLARSAPLPGCFLRHSAESLATSAWERTVRSLLVSDPNRVALSSALGTEVVRWVIRPHLHYQIHAASPGAPKAQSIAVVVNYRDRSSLTLRLLEDLCRQRFRAKHVELVLVDNQSRPEEQAAVLARAAQLPAPWRLKLVSYNKPYNHSDQNNLAVKDTAAEVLVFLNNDARLPSNGTLQNLADHALTPGVATCGPRIVGDSGLVSAGMQIYERPESAEGVGLCESPCWVFSETTRETSGNTFACAAVASTVFRELGGLDAERFPTQYNDADFALRATSKGYRHLLLGSESVFHQPGQTDSQRTQEMVRATYARLLQTHSNLRDHLRIDPICQRVKNSVDLPTSAKRLWRCVDALDRLRGQGPANWLVKNVLRELRGRENSQSGVGA